LRSYGRDSAAGRFDEVDHGFQSRLLYGCMNREALNLLEPEI
jgi:hypothetical protein